jgi:hypothetical protein
VTALDYCQLLTLDRDDFAAFVARQPDLRDKIDAIAERREEENRLAPALA